MLDQKETKVLILDLDGTLTNSEKKITPKTKEAIMDIQKMGHKVMLASGRPTQGIIPCAKELELERYGGYILAFNGGKIINYETKEIIFQKILPQEVIKGLYEFAQKQDCGLITYYGDEIIRGTRMDEYIALESRINSMNVREVENFPEFVTFDVNKCLMTAEPEHAGKCEKMLAEKYGDLLSIYRSEAFFIEVMPKNIDKASSIDRMLSSVGLLRENTICCGDGFNDMTMIEYGGIGVAMGNAKPEVKAKADYITGSNDEDGLVEVIQKYIT